LEYVVVDCKYCGGWCCKSLNSSGTLRSYWGVLSPAEAIERNPWLPINMDLIKNAWSICEHLNDNGLCSYYEYRDEACRQYPNLEFFFLEYLNNDVCTYVPWCAYRSIILQSLNIPFKTLSTGEDCRKKYLQMIREDLELANNFHGKEKLLKQSYEIDKDHPAA
jgi:Fe-S-cluster containining protein